MEHLPADAVFLMTGYHADWELLTDAGVSIDPETRVPVYDPSTFETNVPNIFVAGGVVAGRDTAPIFIENGRFHGEAIVKVLGQRTAQVPRRDRPEYRRAPRDGIRHRDLGYRVCSRDHKIDRAVGRGEGPRRALTDRLSAGGHRFRGIGGLPVDHVIRRRRVAHIRQAVQMIRRVKDH